MDERSVVTVFLTDAGEVLLLRRSEAVGSYAGRWGGVAGHVEPGQTPLQAAHTELTEETGLSPEAVSLLAQGEPFTVSDAELDVRWRVHPFRFETASREVEPNWETAELRWVSPPVIRELPTVPNLWTSWDRVRPTVAAVEQNTTDGSATLSRRALEVLRDEAALLAGEDGGWEAISAVASELKAARASMAVVQVRVDRVMNEASEARTPAAVQEAAAAGIERALVADRQAAAEAASRIEGRTVFTVSRSGTVERALLTGAPAAVRVAVSRPGGEGRDLANSLAAAGHDVTLLGDANVPLGVREAEAVLVGADTVRPDGDVINKAGTTAAALAAERADVPVYVATATAKISPTDDGFLDHSTGDLDADPGVTALDPPFERTPADLVDGILTEDGLLDQAEVAEVAAEHAALAAWE
jgi:translation initiation factor 2B subunit (eIF-2B alpha/beta/delta family)/ADP-ribose pyrophosphatase YjhB (NUDIX family)